MMKKNGDSINTVEQAIFHYIQALQVFTKQDFPQDWADTQNNLGLAYDKYANTYQANTVDQAINHFQQALAVYTSTAFPVGHLRTQHNLGNLYFDKANWLEAQRSYETAIAVGQDLLALAVTDAGRRVEVAETARLFARTAFCQLKQGQIDKALLTLERGKTRLLNETLAQTEVILDDLPLTHQEQYQHIFERIKTLQIELSQPSDTLTRRNDVEIVADLSQARTELNTLIQTIRQTHPDFLPTGLELDQFLALIPAKGALIAPVITSQGSAVFVVPRGQTASVSSEWVVWLDDFKVDDLNSILVGTEDEPGWLRTYRSSQQNLPMIFETMSAMTKQLTEVLLNPICQKLTELSIVPGSPLLLMPQGGLGLLPLHALLLDDYVVTVVPSGYALHTSLQRLAQQPQAITLTAVINPTQDLPFTPAEGEAVINHFTPSQVNALWSEEASKSAVQDALQAQDAQASIFHFSGHGYYSWRDPLQSGLVMANERLTLNDLLVGSALQNTRLVVLSACETGITEFRQTPDEYLGLPAGFLQAGASAVISTLWAVNDLSTMLLMEKFYQFYLQEDIAIPQALRQAQLWLRDVTAGELAERFTTEKLALLRQTRLPQDVVFSANRRFSRDFEPNDRPFAHPYYWAAFTFSGA